MSGMVNFESARHAMVDQQVAPHGVTDRRLLAALRRVPREIFVSDARRALAYSDAHHPLGGHRFLPPPATFARLVQLADISGASRVLDYYPGAGYSCAVLSDLADEVVAFEPDMALADKIRSQLETLGVSNVRVVTDDVEARKFNPFDTILVEAAVQGVPESLLDALVLGGRLVCLVRTGPVGTATVLEKGVDGVVRRTWFNATLPSLDRDDRLEDFVF
jgi:protein-L-isoaspartate(D-aspartate) O-methyltransferase